MGGRSKDRRNDVPDSFAWLKEVSNVRLDRYGKAGRARYLAGAEDPKLKTGSFDAVWDNAAIEYKSRYGIEPEWSPRNTPMRSYPDKSQVSDYRNNMVFMNLVKDGDTYSVKELKLAVYSGGKRGYASKLNGMNRQQIMAYRIDLESQIANIKSLKDHDKHIKLKRLRRAYASTVKVLDSMD